MSGLFRSAFTGFGPDYLRPDGNDPGFDAVTSSKRSLLRKRIRDLCPRQPGVYGMLDPRGVLVYVGKSKELRKRLLSYFRAGSQNEKAGRIIDHTRTVVWESVPNEFAALLRELELIRRWRPRFNVRGMPGYERQVYLCLGRSPAPYVFVARSLTGKEVAAYGPLRGAGMAREAARRLNDMFQLRDCSRSQTMHFADQGDLFPIIRTPGCLRFELATCLGPCAGETTRARYNRQLRALQSLLNGSDVTPLIRIEHQMEQAATAMAFERAAALRDRVQPIQWLRERLGFLKQARDVHSFVYQVAGFAGEDIWYVIRQGRVVMAVPKPETVTRKVVEQIRDVYAKPIVSSFPVDQIDHVLLVAAWFRKYPAEWSRTLTPEQLAAPGS